MKRKLSVVRIKFRCNILISGKIIKEIPGSVASGTYCSAVFRRLNLPRELSHELFLNELYLQLLAHQAYCMCSDHSVLRNAFFLKILTEKQTQF